MGVGLKLELWEHNSGAAVRLRCAPHTIEPVDKLDGSASLPIVEPCWAAGVCRRL